MKPQALWVRWKQDNEGGPCPVISNAEKAMDHPENGLSIDRPRLSIRIPDSGDTNK